MRRGPASQFRLFFQIPLRRHPSTRDDARVLSHADAAAIAYEVPYDRHPAPGSRGSLPRTQVESMSMIAYARVNGVTAFWAASLNTEAGDVRMHWLTEGNDHLLVRAARAGILVERREPQRKCTRASGRATPSSPRALDGGRRGRAAAAAGVDGHALVLPQTGARAPRSSTAHVQMVAHSTHASSSMRRSLASDVSSGSSSHALARPPTPTPTPTRPQPRRPPGAAAAAVHQARRSSSCVARCARASS